MAGPTDQSMTALPTTRFEDGNEGEWEWLGSHFGTSRPDALLHKDRTAPRSVVLDCAVPRCAVPYCPTRAYVSFSSAPDAENPTTTKEGRRATDASLLN